MLVTSRIEVAPEIVLALDMLPSFGENFLCSGGLHPSPFDIVPKSFRVSSIFLV